LKAVDNQIAPEIQQIDTLLKDYYNKDGSVKDSFYSTITNITNKGKELKYDRLNKLIPDIDGRVSALKAFEDVENALNQKTGIYEKIAYYGSLFGV
jgi:superfamily I DNA and RNA helicase